MMKYFYLASLVIGLVLVQGLLRTSQVNAGFVDLQYYDCALNEFTHRYENSIEGVFYGGCKGAYKDIYKSFEIRKLLNGEKNIDWETIFNE